MGYVGHDHIAKSRGGGGGGRGWQNAVWFTAYKASSLAAPSKRILLILLFRMSVRHLLSGVALDFDYFQFSIKF